MIYPDIDRANTKFQALDTLPANVQQVLIAERRVFMTEIRRDGVRFSGTLIAKPKDWNDARRIAYERGLGETVEGCIEDIIRDVCPEKKLTLSVN